LIFTPFRLGSTIHPTSHHSFTNNPTPCQVVWKITPLFAEWLSSPSNPLFTHGLLSPSSLVLELGCGISGLVALLLAPRISHYVLTDQPYVAKLVEQNITENHHPPTSTSAKTARPSKSRPAPPGGRGSPAPGRRETATGSAAGNHSRDGAAAAGIHFTPLDWETDQVTPALTGSAEAKSFDLVVACDCIYNEALVEPFVSTCVDLCRLRADEIWQGKADEPCVCVIAQQLRDPAVFEAWLERFNREFHTWRVPDEMLGEGLRANSGFVVHVGVLRDDVSLQGV
jgi:predicted nicotinamide N-methyase